MLWKFRSKNEWLSSVADLLSSDAVQSMRRLPQHRKGFSCYHHCLLVSYTSFLLCRRLGWHAREAARGAMLHDLFLYDWHLPTCSGWDHCWHHPQYALQNAKARFLLTPREQDAILSHMFPLSLTPHHYKESWVVGAMDKLCALMELLGLLPREIPAPIPRACPRAV